MSYLDLFQRYGNPSREAEIRLTAAALSRTQSRPRRRSWAHGEHGGSKLRTTIPA